MDNTTQQLKQSLLNTLKGQEIGKLSTLWKKTAEHYEGLGIVLYGGFLENSFNKEKQEWNRGIEVSFRAGGKEHKFNVLLNEVE